MSIYVLGMVMTGLLSTNATSVEIATGGVTIATDGLTLIEDTTYVTNGIVIYGNTTIDSGTFDSVNITSNGIITYNVVNITEGLVVEEGSVTVYSNGLSILHGLTIQNYLLSSTAVSIEAGGASVYGGVNTTHINLYTDSGSGNGGMTVHDSGISVHGLIHAIDTGVSVKYMGLSITGGYGVNITDKMLVHEGLYVTNGSMTILSGGLVTSGGDHAGDIYILSNNISDVNSVYNNTMPDIHINNRGMNVTSGSVTINSGGLNVTGGVLLNSGGFYLTGGLCVLDDGLVASVVTISTGGLHVYNDITINTGGLVVNQLANVSSLHLTDLQLMGLGTSNGITINTHGLMLTSGGLSVVDGLTLLQGSVNITGSPSNVHDGVTVETNGVIVHQGGLILNLNAVEHGLLTVHHGCVNVSNDGGMHVTMGAFVHSDGVYVNDSIVTVYGPVWFQSSPVVFSDRRLKTDIQPLNDTLSKLRQLNGVYYTLKTSPRSYHSISSTDSISGSGSSVSDVDQRHIGLIAQEVASVFPELVQTYTHSTDGQQYLGVAYPELVPVAIEAIKELHDKILGIQARAIYLRSLTHKTGSMLSEKRASEKTRRGQNYDRSAVLAKISELTQLVHNLESRTGTTAFHI